MNGENISPSIAGKAWSFLRSGDFRGLWQAMNRRRALLRQLLTSPVGSGTLLLDPQTDLGVLEKEKIEESISPHSVSHTRLALHLAPYQYALRYVEGKEVLDVGCNWGYGSHLFARKARRVVGFDVNSEHVSYGKQQFARENLCFLIHDANERFPFADERFDVVFSSEVIEHLANYTGCLHEMQRVLRPNGLFILKTPNLAYSRHWHALNPYHLKVFLPKELQTLLGEYFLEVEVFGFNEVYDQVLRRLKKSFDPYGFEFEQRIPCPQTIELEVWVQPELVPISDGVPQSLLAMCRAPKRRPPCSSKTGNAGLSRLALGGE